MYVKLILFLFCITISEITSQITKCSDGPPNACGPNASCFDDQNDENYQSLGGPYCKCSDDSYGRPPNCKPRCSYDGECEEKDFCDISGSKECIEGCREVGSCEIGEYCVTSKRKCSPGCKYDRNCNTDEFCYEKKCQKLCDEKSCGENGKCLGKDHTKYCTCAAGYIPDKSSNGCRKQEISGEKLNCTDSCHLHNKCLEENDKLYCYCPQQTEANPFFPCGPAFGFFPGAPEPFKPASDTQIISLQTVMILTG